MDLNAELPDSKFPDLYLTQPTPEECVKIWTANSVSWTSSLTLQMYLKECLFLATVPLAKNGGMTTWILVDKNLPPNQRPILCCSESFRKRSLTSDASGNVEENVVHGIASVFCAPQYRSRGYAARHMIEMAKALRTWQAELGRCVGTILYSDIGKAYYTKLGWTPNATNSQLVFQPTDMEWPALARSVGEEELKWLCRRDEEMVRAAMAMPAPAVKRRVTILPDLDHMLWHIRKEGFVTTYIFGEKPRAKGAIAGSLGKQVWAVWTHRYYGHPEQGASDNVLYILRLVVEGDATANKARASIGELPPSAEYAEQAVSLEAVLQAAQVEAAKWRLNDIKLWDPSPLVHSLLSTSGLDFVEEQRIQESVASGMWYDNDGGFVEAPVWINNEHYAWL